MGSINTKDINYLSMFSDILNGKNINISPMTTCLRATMLYTQWWCGDHTRADYRVVVHTKIAKELIILALHHQSRHKKVIPVNVPDDWILQNKNISNSGE